MRKNAGFTIIEMMIVIGIIGLVTAVSIPNVIGWMADRRLNSSAREVYAALQISRLKAVKENARVVVDFDVAANQVIAFVDNGESGGVARNWTRDGGEQTIASTKSAVGVDLTDVTVGDGLIGYEPQGPVIYSDGSMLAGDEEIHFINENHNYLGLRFSLIGNPEMISSNDGENWD